MRLIKTALISTAAAAFLAGTALAVPTGARADDGQPLLLGRDNHFSGYTYLIFDAAGRGPLPGDWNWSEGDWEPGPGVTVKGSAGIDKVWAWKGLWATNVTTNYLWAKSDRDADVAQLETLGAGHPLVVKSSNATDTVKSSNGGAGPALTAANTSASATGAALVASAGAKGRGAKFSGGAAQVQLQPGTEASHPKTGMLGDLYLDRTGRLWLCKGGTTWSRLD